MLGRSHAILGASATAVTLITSGTNLIQHPLLFLTAWGIGILAALMPDLDTPNAAFRRIFGLGRRQTRLRHRQKLTPTALLQRLLAIPFNFLDWFLPHRGPSHYGLTCLILTLLMRLLIQHLHLPDPLWQAFGVGYASHLIGDGVTRAGIKLYAPFYTKSVRLVPRFLTIRTGSWGETAMLAALIALLGLYFYAALFL